MLTMLVALGVVGSLLFNNLNLQLPSPNLGSGSSGSSSSDNSAASGTYQRSSGEPEATYNYIRGQQIYDAKLIWNAYSDRAVQSLQSQGATVDVLQRQLDRSKQQGAQIQKAQYVGSYPIPNGSMHFYVITRTGRTRGDVTYVPYVFTLDSGGKIDNVE